MWLEQLSERIISAVKSRSEAQTDAKAFLKKLKLPGKLQLGGSVTRYASKPSKWDEYVLQAILNSANARAVY